MQGESEKDMKNIEKWLSKNDINFRMQSCDGIPGIFVSMNAYEDSFAFEKLNKFEKYMSKKRGYIAKPIRQYMIYSFHIRAEG